MAQETRRREVSRGSEPALGEIPMADLEMADLEMADLERSR